MRTHRAVLSAKTERAVFVSPTLLPRAHRGLRIVLAVMRLLAISLIALETIVAALSCVALTCQSQAVIRTVRLVFALSLAALRAVESTARWLRHTVFFGLEPHAPFRVTTIHIVAAVTHPG